MKPKLLMLKGLQASGKSTYAKTLVEGSSPDQGHRDWKRVNKDDLRAMVDNGKWSKKNEELIKDLESTIAEFFLIEGFSVVVDDTNFAYEEHWKNVATQKDVDFEVKFFDTPLGECIERDVKRGDKSVGAQVICSTYEKYLYHPVPYSLELRDCYIFDIDGTLAKMNGRSPYDYTRVHTDIPNGDVTEINRMIAKSSSEIFIFSGRDGSCYNETEKWLKDNDIFYTQLCMRSEGDKRKDSIIKEELYEKYIKGQYNVIGVFDDRLQVCRMWYELGLPLFRVGNPDSDF